MSEKSWSWKNMTLTEFLSEGNIPYKWKEFFDRKDIRIILEKISAEITRVQYRIPIYPEINRVFRAFEVSLRETKVVILGQDCYHNPGSAVGLCFSVPKGAKINPSLRNIYDELENEGFVTEKNGSLAHWAKQGCLMLNTALTVEQGSPESHLEIWYPFSEKVLEYISENTKNVAWLLMGAKAMEFQDYAKRNGHKAFLTSHPSPFSAHKSCRGSPAFLGSGVFQKINEFLGERKIMW